jgi:hypothetical protein
VRRGRLKHNPVFAAWPEDPRGFGLVFKTLLPSILCGSLEPRDLRQSAQSGIWEKRRLERVMDTKDILKGTGPLADEQGRALMKELWDNARHAPVTYEVRVMLALISSIGELDKTSTRLSKIMIWLTVLIAALTVAAVVAALVQIRISAAH